MRRHAKGAPAGERPAFEGCSWRPQDKIRDSGLKKDILVCITRRYLRGIFHGDFLSEKERHFHRGGRRQGHTRMTPPTLVFALYFCYRARRCLKHPFLSQ